MRRAIAAYVESGMRPEPMKERRARTRRTTGFSLEPPTRHATCNIQKSQQAQRDSIAHGKRGPGRLGGRQDPGFRRRAGLSSGAWAYRFPRGRARSLRSRPVRGGGTGCRQCRRPSGGAPASRGISFASRKTASTFRPMAATASAAMRPTPVPRPGDSVISADGKTLKTARGAPEAAAAGCRVASGSIPVAAC